MLERRNSAFIYILKNKALHASYDLWHARLGHVSHFVISLLNKNGHLYLTSLLPSPSLCDTCQIKKNHRLPYSRNERHSFMCWILFIAIFGVSPPLNQLWDLFIMCYSFMIIPALLSFTL